jgi:hypothetical protein
MSGLTGTRRQFDRGQSVTIVTEFTDEENTVLRAAGLEYVTTAPASVLAKYKKPVSGTVVDVTPAVDGDGATFPGSGPVYRTTIVLEEHGQYWWRVWSPSGLVAADEGSIPVAKSQILT